MRVAALKLPPMAGLDPYLVWADATGYADFSAVGAGPPERVRVVVQLKTGCTPEQLHAALGEPDSVAPAYREPAAGTAPPGYCTAWFKAADCARPSLAVQDVVQRFELAMPVLPRRAPTRQPPPRPVASVKRPVPEAPSQTAVLLAVIDAGCPFAHAAFRRKTHPRVLSLWDQDPEPAFGTASLPGAVPPAFGYGREASRSEIQALIAACPDEDAVYERAHYPELRRGATHGAMVMDQFIGRLRLGDRLPADADTPPSWRADGDQASDTADLVFVQLPRATWADPNGLALSASVLDGLHHILACCGPATRRVVLNLSCALHTGPHDGSSLLDGAIAELVKHQALAGRELIVVVPAGNSHLQRWHAAGTLVGGAPQTLRWRVPPGCEAPSFLQVWVCWPADAKGRPLIWTVRAPGADAAVEIAEPGKLLPGRALALRSTSLARGGKAGQELLFLALPAAADADAAGAAGDWLLTLQTPDGNAPLEVTVRVARNLPELGAPLRHRASQLIDARYDPERALRAARSDTPAAAPGLRVLRAGTRSALADGKGVFVAAGLRLWPTPVAADYSSDGLPPERSAAAASDLSPSRPGVRGAGTRSAAVVRLQGTSFAAPQLARAFADEVLPDLPIRRGNAAPDPVPVPSLAPIRDDANDLPAPRVAERATRVGTKRFLPRLRALK